TRRGSRRGCRDEGRGAMMVNLACGMVLALLAAAGPPEVEGTLEPGKAATVTIPAGQGARARTVALLIALKKPARMAPGTPVMVAVEGPGATLHKTLHLGDPDVTWLVRQPAAAAIRLVLEADK